MSHQRSFWKLTSSIGSKDLYTLTDEQGTEMLQLTFDTTTDTVHVTRNEVRRIFHIQKQGFLRTKIHVQNEYGVTIGYWTMNKTDHALANVVLYEEKYKCHVTNEVHGEFTITQLRNNNSIQIELPVADGHFAGIQGNELLRITAKQSSFIFATCMYLQKAGTEQVKVA